MRNYEDSCPEAERLNYPTLVNLLCPFNGCNLRTLCPFNGWNLRTSCPFNGCNLRTLCPFNGCNLRTSGSWSKVYFNTVTL